MLPVENDVRKNGGSSESITTTSHCNDGIKPFNATNTQNYRLVHLFNLKVLFGFLSLKVHNLDSIVALVEYPACSCYFTLLQDLVLVRNLWSELALRCA